MNAAEIVVELSETGIACNKDSLIDCIGDILFDLNSNEDQLNLINQLIKISPSNLFTEVILKFKKELVDGN